jgi:hypothetical protein
MAPLFEGGILAGALAIAATIGRTIKNFFIGKADKPNGQGESGDGQIGRPTEGK